MANVSFAHKIKMGKTLKALYDEHQVILKVIEAVLKECKKPILDPIFFKKAIDFIKNYADKLHHAKEEDILFNEFDRIACESGLCNPVQQMLHEHDLGREFVRGMVAGLKEENKVKIIKNAQGYAELLKEHIGKEDDILYPMAEEALNETTKKKMLVKFKKVDGKKKAERTKYLAFANKLK